MASIKTVAFIGASGQLGKPVLKVLLDSGKFDVTVVQRSESTSTFPSSVKVIFADFLSVASLTSAFSGIDAVVSTLGIAGLLGQSVLIDAAIAAGVKRFVPSEFGSDLSNPKTAALPVFGHKIATRKHLEESIIAQEGEKMTYTYIMNGIFLDWGLAHGFFFDAKDESIKIYDGGKQLFSTTTLATVGLGLVGVLSNFEKTKNKDVYIQDIALTQTEVLEIAESVKSDGTWKVKNLTTDDVKKGADEKLAKGDFSAMYDYIPVAIYKVGYGGFFEKNDNSLVGIPGKTKDEVKDLIKGVLV